MAISCGDDHNLVLKSDGTIFAWGANYSGQTNIPSSLSNVVAIAAGDSGNFAIRSDGTTWGSGPMSNMTGVVAGTVVASGQYQGAVVRSDGLTYAWGCVYGTNLVILTNVISVVGRSPFNQAGTILALRRDGTVIGLGLNHTNEYPNLSNVLAVAMGYSVGMAIAGDSFPQPVEPMLNYGFVGGQFIISQPTSLGRSYRYEYKNSLTDDWEMSPPIPGNGSTQTLADPTPPSSQRLYRVRVGQ